MRIIHQTKLMILAVSIVGLFIFMQCSEVMEPEKSKTDPIDKNSIYSDGSNEVVIVNDGKYGMTDQEKADLLYMREEEKLARDIYLFLYEKWELPIFTKIAASEQRHMDALKRLIDKHNMTDIDPVEIEPDAGEYINEEIQALYIRFTVTELPESKEEALDIGVTVEGYIIQDLENFLTRVDNQDIINVYENILAGSIKHLNAFQDKLQ